MNKTKLTFVFGFALFAGFFGAGNLILPPFLGFQSGADWWLVALGFILSATFIPLLALFGHAKLQGTLLDFGNKVSPRFSLVYSFLVVLIAVFLPSPRTAAVAHEMSIAPYFEVSSLVTSTIFFVLVLLFALKRSKVLDLLGRYLTPIIVLIILLIILIGVFSSGTEMNPTQFKTPFVDGFLEGYQTYDAIAGVLMGGMLIISLNKMGTFTVVEKKQIIAKSSVIAMLGLLIVYIGLLAIGAFYNSEFESGISRSELLLGLSTKTIGNMGSIFLSVLVGLACFTTAVAVIVSIADLFKSYLKNSHQVYVITSIICCVIGVVVGQFDVRYIIDVAIPILLFIYPITIALILLNAIPDKYTSTLVFRLVILVTFLFSIPDVLKFLMPSLNLASIQNLIPFSDVSLGWILPALVAFVIGNVVGKR